MKNRDVNLLLKFMEYTTEDILFEFTRLAGARYIDTWPQFVYRRGTREDSPLLIGHADTVWADNTCSPMYYQGVIGPRHLLVPRTQHTIPAIFNKFKSATGIGADDRAGLALIYLLVKNNLDLSFLITTEEETALGPLVIPELSWMPEFIKGHPWALEFDFPGNRAFTCYNGDGKKFRDWLEEETGFNHTNGSFSDIVMCDNLINSANVSIGYRNQHTEYEVLSIRWWENTKTAFSKLLQKKQPTWRDFNRGK